MKTTLRRLAPPVGLVLVQGTILAILGPYNTNEFGMPWVWIYWTSLMGLGLIAAYAFERVFDRHLGDWPRPAYAVAQSIAVTLPVTLAVALVQYLTDGPFPLEILPMIFFFVWVIAIVIVTITMVVEGRMGGSGSARAGAGDGGPGEGPAIGAALTEKLPVRLREAPILALQAEDHYLRVHTPLGDSLILMRLSDAIAAVEALDGARTHRSWWVAREAVTDANKSGGRATLTLSTGVQAPVSRTHARTLREAGWF
ncbi:LytTr DNA-binding domain protein [Marinicauda pacifica]|nr:LytTR family DNA-binding domain-containing protein [Marinicauda pacifica]GGE38108.1 LytTr DNA-binding domain protein [Marinicauda pacifica]